MLFYASLFVFCIVLSAVGLWFYRAVNEAAKTVYRAFLPSSKGNYRAKKLESLSDSLGAAQTPWGWSSNGSSRRALPVAIPKKQAPLTAPWGWQGNKKSSVVQAKSRFDLPADAESVLGSPFGVLKNQGRDSRNSPDKARVGWPYREESFEFAGKQFKVIRKRNKKKTNLGSLSKPWGW